MTFRILLLATAIAISGIVHKYKNELNAFGHPEARFLYERAQKYQDCYADIELVDGNYQATYYKKSTGEIGCSGNTAK